MVEMSWERLARIAARRPAVTVAIVLLAALAGGVLALGLKPSAATDTFVSRSTASYKATADDDQHFGDDAVIILIKEPLTSLVETKDLGTVTELEACLAGQVVVANSKLASFTPAVAGSKPPYGGWSSPCGKLMKLHPAQAVYGPGTFLNRAVAAVNQGIQSLLTASQQSVRSAEQNAYQLALGRHLSKQQALSAANAAGQLEQEQQITQLEQTYLDSGITGTPSIDDPQFIPQIVFDQTRGVNQPKARFAYLFPTKDSALIQVRLKSTLSDTQQASAISLIRQAVKMPMFRSGYGGTYTVTGEPVVVNDLASQITGSILGLLIAAVLVMAATLLFVFRKRLRLLPLGIALAAAGITFGATSLVGASLTMASIAVLPILIGLAVDYAIQFQSRVEEARGDPGSEAATGEAVVRAAGVGAPAIATAALATAAGFLVLLLSPVPMVQGFGVLLVVGIAIALAVALTAGSAMLVLSDRSGGVFGASWRGAAEIVGDLGGGFAAPVRGAGEILSGVAARVRRLAPRRRRAGTPARARASRGWGTHLLQGVVSHPGRVLAAGLVLAAVGWFADTQTAVQSDVTKLVPSSMPALRNLRTLEQITGVSGEIDVTVRSSDVTDLSTVRWMIDYEQSLLGHYGYVDTKGCAQSTLCPALSLPDLFSAGSASPQATAASLTQTQIRSLLAAVPAYFSQAVITPDHHEAVLAFGIRLMPLSRQQKVIDYMQSQLHPPPGVSAQLAGLPVIAAEANTALSSSARRLLTMLAGLIAVGIVLLAVFRRVERALVPLIPIALATGWSALILFATRIPLNPMSATLGALVIAISTEFSVLLSERFRQERAKGRELRDALTRTYRSTGTAVLASGITAIMGFGVLVLSNITMLRDFGFVTLIDMSVSLGGVLLVLPAVLVLAERGDAVEGVRTFVARTAATLPLPRRRRARVA
jgi:uncharacterized protein